MKVLFFIAQCLCYLSIIHCAQAQNLANNPSFEVCNVCPNGTAPGIQPTHCPPWLAVPGGTADYFNPCSLSPETDAPSNTFGYQQARTGSAYVGVICSGISKEYVQSQLTATLTAGRRYYACMYVSLGNTSQFALDRLGFYFSANSLQQIAGNPNNQPWIPQIVNTAFNFLTDTLNWMKVDGIFTASGGEQWVSFGNFTGISSNTTLVNALGSFNRAYYFVDDICIVDLDTPPVTIDKKDTIICDYPAVLTAPNTGEKYLWSTGDTTANLVINTPGNYWVKTIHNCSYVMDSIIVKIAAPQYIRTSLDTFLCANQIMTFATPASASNIIWSTGSTNTSISISGIGNYWVKYDMPNCKKHVDTFHVFQAENNSFDIRDTIVCNQSLYQLWIPEGYQWQVWQDGSTEKYFLIQNSGKYWVQATTRHYCIISDTFTITLTDTRQKFSDTTVCEGEPFLHLLKPAISSTASLLWQDGSTLPYLNITKPGTYRVEITDGPCSSTSQMTVRAEYCDCPFLVPNAFTPNGDGLNDAFGVSFPEACVVRGYILQVFNRWGQLVFSSYDPQQKWNGYFGSEPSEAGTFFYSVQFESGTRGTRFTKKGDMVLIR